MSGAGFAKVQCHVSCLFVLMEADSAAILCSPHRSRRCISARRPPADAPISQIVESRRDGGQVRQQVIATLGRYEDLRESGQLERLLRSGERISCKAMVVDAVVHAHMLRHACGYALANAGHDTRSLQGLLSVLPGASNEATGEPKRRAKASLQKSPLGSVRGA